MEEVVQVWNSLSMNFPLSVSDLSPTVKPVVLMGALVEILTAELGIDREAIIAPPEERDEHTEYYWDLLPAINMTRILNHEISAIQDVITVSMADLLHPSPLFAQNILRLLMNLASFYRERREHIEPMERELFAQREQVAALEEQKNNMLERLNEQAAAKASRAIRLQKLEEERKQRAEELKAERLQHEDELRELEQVIGENKALQATLDKERAARESLAAELGRVRAQRVTDADDIRAQQAAAARREREVAERLDALKAALLEKEGAARGLRAVHARLREGIAHVHDITALSDALKKATLSPDREQAEVDATVSEREGALRDAEAQLAGLQRERRELRDERLRDAAAAKAELAAAHSAAAAAEVALRARRERVEREAARTLELRALTEQHARDKLQLDCKLQRLQDDYLTQLKSFEEGILKESKKSSAILKEKLERHSKR